MQSFNNYPGLFLYFHTWSSCPGLGWQNFSLVCTAVYGNEVMVWDGVLLWVTAQKKVTDSDNLEYALTNSF